MACLDMSGNERIPIMMETVGALSRAETPQEVLRSFTRGMERLYGAQGFISLSTRNLPAGQYKITRMYTGGERWHMNDDNPWRDWGELTTHRGGFLGELIRTASPVIIPDFRLPHDPVVGNRLQDYGSLMAVPLFDGGEALNWGIMLRRERAGYTMEDLEQTILRGNLIGTSIRNVITAHQLRAANETIRREVEQIASIQRALLPTVMPEISGVKIAAHYETHDQAGGDYYDFLPLRCDGERGGGEAGGPWGILIADAAGHGPAAAVLMAMLHAILHAYPKMPEGPAEVLDHANHHLWRKGIASSYVTAFFAIYDPPTRRLRYARAGHPPPLLKRAGPGGRVTRLDGAGSVPLGVLDGVRHEQAEVTLEVGQTLALYTDGITEAMSPEGRMFGVDGIEAALERCTGEPGCVQDSVMEALIAHEDGVEPRDDQTLVAMRVEGE